MLSCAASVDALKGFKVLKYKVGISDPNSHFSISHSHPNLGHSRIFCKNSKCKTNYQLERFLGAGSINSNWPKQIE